MRRVVDLIVLAVVIAVGASVAYTHQAQVHQVIRNVQTFVAPCSKPLTYSLGAIDLRFHIATSTVLADLSESEALWEKPFGNDLFTYVPQGGDVTVSLVYDERQAATDKLKSAGYAIGKSRASYESLKTTYDALATQVSAEQATYQAQVTRYRERLDSYNAQVQAWNQKGGAPRAIFDELEREKEALAQEFSAVQASQASLNRDVDTVNALATTLNQLIVQLNINVTQYNQVGASAGGFEEGLYQSQGGVETIAIYEYANRTQLIRVLAHELGHALGLEHVDDEKAIMYKINQGEALLTTSADLAELARVCKTHKN